MLKAPDIARRHELRSALDIDYRPVLWKLTSLDEGKTRFIASSQVIQQLQPMPMPVVRWWFPATVAHQPEVNNLSHLFLKPRVM